MYEFDRGEQTIYMTICIYYTSFVFILISLKMIIESPINGSWIIPFKNGKD